MWRTLLRSQARVRAAHELHTARADGFLAKLRFRKDGSPRSKVAGVVNVSLFLITLRYGLLYREQRSEPLKDALKGASATSIFFKGFKLQYVDMRHYDQVNFDNPEECFNYYFQLLDCVLSFSTEEERQGRKTFMNKLRSHIDLCHTPMRHAAEDVHREFQRLARDPSMAKGIDVIPKIPEYVTRTIDVVTQLIMLEIKGEMPHVPSIVEDQGRSGSGNGYGALG